MSTIPLDPVIHAPNRLQICALLAVVSELEFRLLKGQLGVSDSVLSKQLKALEEAKYIDVIKRTEHGRQRTWLALNRVGRQAFQNHVQALRQIIEPGAQALNQS
jgi:DNA-binding MarR family transcriptional regulator